MKKLTDYIQESQQWMESPGEGDTFGIELADDTLLETYVMEVADDGSVLLDSTEEIYGLLESWNMLSDDIDTDEHAMEQRDAIDEIAPLAAVAGGALARAAAGRVAAKIGDALDGEETVNEFDMDARPDPGEYDTEGDMAKNELLTIIRAARKLTGMLDDEANMPEWTQKKITKAADYVDTAADYVASQKERGVMEQGVAEGSGAQAYDDFRKAMLKQKGTPKSPAPKQKTDGEKAYDEFRKARLKKGVAEGSEETSPVSRAVLHRIMMAHPGVLAQHGPERVMSAVDELADRVNIGPDDEIGTSDVSGWTRDVIRMLAELPDESMSDVDGLGEQDMSEAEYQGRDVELNKPTRGDVKKFKVYVKDPKTGNVKKVNFGDPNMRIKKSDPARRKSFRARHKCDTAKDKTTARYWSCRKW